MTLAPPAYDPAPYRLFPDGTTPEYATAAWYEGRDTAPHVDQELHRPRLERTALYVRQALREHGLSTVSDLGAGDGGLLSLVKDPTYGPKGSAAPDVWGYDLQPTNVDVARRVRGVAVSLLDFVRHARDVSWGEVVVMTEVLEHLVDPLQTLRRAHAAGTPRVLVCSSPYTETRASHYEYHLWAWDAPGYDALLESAGWVVERRHLTEIFQVVTAVRG